MSSSEASGDPVRENSCGLRATGSNKSKTLEMEAIATDVNSQLLQGPVTEAGLNRTLNKLWISHELTKKQSQSKYLIDNASELWALIEMKQLIAPADIPRDPIGYIRFLWSLLAIRNLLESWHFEHANNSLGIDSLYRGFQPIRLIRYRFAELANHSTFLHSGGRMSSKGLPI